MNAIRFFCGLILFFFLTLPHDAFAVVGSVDASFDAPAPNDWVRAIALETNGNIIIAGDFLQVTGTNRTRIARLFPNGHLDLSFAAGGGPDGYVNSVAVQSDGKILIAGNFSNVAGTPRNKFARLNANGTVDTTFAATQPVAVSGEGKQIIALADGRALLVGPATIFYFSPSFITRNSVIMLTTNGLIDTSFANAPLAASAVLCVAARPGGKYLVGGAFTTTGGSVRTNLVQLDNTGAQDNSFVQAPVSDLGFVRTLHPMSDGRIVINGAGAGTNYIRRVNNDGTVDGSFTSASSDAAILTAAVQPDGKIWIAGDFLWINDVQRLKVARLNLDGSLDLSYNSGDGTGTSVFALTLQPDGKLLMGGAFGCYNNICIGHIIRLLGDFTASSPRLVGSTFSVFVQTTTGKNYTLQYKNLLSDLNWTSLPSVPGDGTEKLLSDPNAIGTQRIYRVVEN